MADTASPITVLSDDTCWGYLASQEVGRLVTAIGNTPEIFPVNFVLDGQSVVFRTAEGSKLYNVIANERIAFECDGWDADGGWSVVLHGTAQVVTEDDELERLSKAPLRPWVPTPKPMWVRLVAEKLSGRQFAFGPESTQH